MRKTLHVNAGIPSPIGTLSIETKDAFLGNVDKKWDIQFTVTRGTAKGRCFSYLAMLDRPQVLTGYKLKVSAYGYRWHATLTVNADGEITVR